MNHRADHPTDDVITQFLRTRSADPDLSLLDDIVRTVGSTPQDRPWLGLRPILLPRRTLLIVAITLLIATMGAIGVGSRLLQPDPLVSAFGGTWLSTSDADGGTQTMNVGVSADGAVDITVHDTIATVCSGTPSTMTGTGAIEGGTQLVIPSPVYTCDDGSEPQALSGPLLEEQLRNWTLALDPQTGTLSDGVGGVWYREGAVVPSPDSSSQPTISGQMWPQTTLEEVRQAQTLADAGDPGYTWQLDPELAANAEPWEAAIFERFIQEELGWEEFRSGSSIQGYGSMGEGGGLFDGVLFIRCAPGGTNPLSSVHPNMPGELRGCAPTIDEFRYETVRFTVEQPARRGPSGIWVVTAWEMLQSGEPYSTFDHLYPDFDQRQVEQLVPPTDEEASALLQSFLGARVDGEGAEQYVHRHLDGWDDREVPILYTTTGGSPYERYEIDRLQGPVWPSGWIEFRSRLFAQDGTVVEQSFVVVRQEDGRLGLVYGFPQTDDFPTTENGQPVPVPYRFLDGEVTFAAAPPWSGQIEDPTYASLGRLEGGSASQFTTFAVVADPRTATGCEAGSAAADAEALVRSIRSNPDLDATAPVAVTVGGIDALRMDVVAPGQPEVGDCAPMVLERLSLVQGEARMRVYLLDLPEGMSARLLAIAISAHESMFDDVVEAATPVLDSLEFHTP